MEGHISRAFDGALASLHMRVIAMGGLALDQVREATRAYADCDGDRAALVLEREKTINAYDIALEDEQLTLIARRQPVASDLRIVIALSKAVAELERIGDEAKKIAKIVRRGNGHPDPETIRDVQHLGQLAVTLLRQSLIAFDSLECALAAPVIDGDRALDAEYAEGLRRLLSRTTANPQHFETAMNAAFVLKSLERVGDHARNLARHLQSIQPPAAAEAPVARIPDV